MKSYTKAVMDLENVKAKLSAQVYHQESRNQELSLRNS